MLPRIFTLAVIATAQSWSFSDFFNSVIDSTSQYFSVDGEGGKFLETVGLDAPDSPTFIQDSIDSSKEKLDDYVITPAKEKLEEYSEVLSMNLPDLGAPMYIDDNLLIDEPVEGELGRPISSNMVLELLRDPSAINPDILSLYYYEITTFFEASQTDASNIEDLVGLDKLKENLGDDFMTNIQDRIDSALVYVQGIEAMFHEQAMLSIEGPFADFISPLSSIPLFDPFPMLTDFRPVDGIWDSWFEDGPTETPVDPSVLAPLISIFPESDISINQFVMRYAFLLRKELLVKYPPPTSDPSLDLSDVDLEVGVYQLVQIIEKELESMTQETKQKLVDLINSIPDDSLPFITELKEAAGSLFNNDKGNEANAGSKSSDISDLEAEISSMMGLEIIDDVLSGQGMVPIQDLSQGFGSLRHRINKQMMNRGITLINMSSPSVSLRPDAFKVTGDDEKVIGVIQVFDTPYYPGDAIPSLNYLDINKLGNPFILSSSGVAQVNELKSFMDSVTNTSTTTSSPTTLSTTIPALSVDASTTRIFNMTSTSTTTNKVDPQVDSVPFDMQEAIVRGNSYVKDVFNYRRGNLSNMEMPDSMYQIIGNKQQVAGILQLYNMPYMPNEASNN